MPEKYFDSDKKKTPLIVKITFVPIPEIWLQSNNKTKFSFCNCKLTHFFSIKISNRMRISIHGRKDEKKGFLSNFEKNKNPIIIRINKSWLRLSSFGLK